MKFSADADIYMAKISLMKFKQKGDVSLLKKQLCQMKYDTEAL